MFFVQVAEASRGRECGDAHAASSCSLPKETESFQYPEERVVRLNPSQHVFYCCPSKDPTEQNCGKNAAVCLFDSLCVLERSAASAGTQQYVSGHFLRVFKSTVRARAC